MLSTLQADWQSAFHRLPAWLACRNEPKPEVQILRGQPASKPAGKLAACGR